jgi:hypothetical protein
MSAAIPPFMSADPRPYRRPSSSSPPSGSNRPGGAIADWISIQVPAQDQSPARASSAKARNDVHDRRHALMPRDAYAGDRGEVLDGDLRSHTGIAGWRLAVALHELARRLQHQRLPFTDRCTQRVGDRGRLTRLSEGHELALRLTSCLPL